MGSIKDVSFMSLRTIMYIIKGSGDVTVKYDSIKGGTASKMAKLR